MSQISSIKGLKHLILESMLTTDVKPEINHLRLAMEVMLKDGRGVGEKVMLIRYLHHHGQRITCLTAMNDFSKEKWRNYPYDGEKEIYWDTWD